MRLLILLLVMLPVVYCEAPKPAQGISQSREPRVSLIQAFFRDIRHNITNNSGLWIADADDIEKYIQNHYLVNYTPKPNENSKTTIESLLKDSSLFFRIEGNQVGQLFVIKKYNLTVSAGNLFDLKKQANTHSYKMVLNKRTSDGKIKSETSEMVYDFIKDIWVYKLKGYSITLKRENRNPEELIELYASGFLSSLKEY